MLTHERGQGESAGLGAFRTGARMDSSAVGETPSAGAFERSNTRVAQLPLRERCDEARDDHQRPG